MDTLRACSTLKGLCGDATIDRKEKLYIRYDFIINTCHQYTGIFHIDELHDV